MPRKWSGMGQHISPGGVHLPQLHIPEHSDIHAASISTPILVVINEAGETELSPEFTGPEGPEGPEGKEGKEGPEGPEGPPGEGIEPTPPNGTLISGVLEKGVARSYFDITPTGIPRGLMMFATGNSEASCWGEIGSKYGGAQQQATSSAVGGINSFFIRAGHGNNANVMPAYPGQQRMVWVREAGTFENRTAVWAGLLFPTIYPWEQVSLKEEGENVFSVKKEYSFEVEINARDVMVLAALFRTNEEEPTSFSHTQRFSGLTPTGNEGGIKKRLHIQQYQNPTAGKQTFKWTFNTASAWSVKIKVARLFE